MIEKLRETRFLWSVGMKYTGLIAMFFSVATLIGVWFKEVSFFSKIFFLVSGTIFYILFIIFAGYLDYRLGFMEKDVSKTEGLSPMWIEQVKVNKKILNLLQDSEGKHD